MSIDEARYLNPQEPTTLAHRPRAALVLTNWGLAYFCDGVAIEIQEHIGSTFHDYASTFAILQARWGEPTVTVSNDRSSAGEVSQQTALWDVGNHQIRLGFLQVVGDVNVTRSFLDGTTCE